LGAAQFSPRRASRAVAAEGVWRRREPWVNAPFIIFQLFFPSPAGAAQAFTITAKSCPVDTGYPRGARFAIWVGKERARTLAVDKMESFFKKVRQRFYKNYSDFLWAQIVYAVVAAGLTFYWQYEKGMITHAAYHDNAVTIFMPYLLIALALLIYHALRSIVLVGKESHDALQERVVISGKQENQIPWTELSERKSQLEDEVAQKEAELKHEEAKDTFVVLPSKTGHLI
jgi:hypothetical protein